MQLGTIRFRTEEVSLRACSRILAASLTLGIGHWCISAQQIPANRSVSPQRVAALAPGERIPNLDTLKDEVRQYHDCTCNCGCYAKDLDLQADRAIAFLHRRIIHPDPHQKLALVLDIDETTLSNYEEMVNAGFAYDSKAFGAWVDSANAPAIAATLRVYKQAQQLDVSIFFLTGRGENQREVTERNLHSQGFDQWQQLILRQPTQKSLTAEAYKSAERAKLQSQGYKIILNIGDQWSDLRGDPKAEYSVKYPDPYYFLK